MCNDKPSYEELVEEKNGWRRLHDKYLKKCEELEFDNAKLREELKLDEVFAERDALQDKHAVMMREFTVLYGIASTVMNEALLEEILKEARHSG